MMPISKEFFTHIYHNVLNLNRNFFSEFIFERPIYFPGWFFCHRADFSICIPSGTHSHRFLCILSENKSGKIQIVLFSNVSLQKRKVAVPGFKIGVLSKFSAYQVGLLILFRCTPDICHNHHNRWLCKLFQSSVKFSMGT